MRGKAMRGTARRCEARRGVARLGASFFPNLISAEAHSLRRRSVRVLTAWSLRNAASEDWQCEAWMGTAGRGAARWGLAWQGRVLNSSS